MHDQDEPGEYYPAPETEGGWRKNNDPGFVRSLGIDPDKLEAFGQYNLSLPNCDRRPWSDYKGVIVVKNGWVIGEWYEGEHAQTFLQYVASNGKSFTIVCLGIIFDASRRGDLLFDVGVRSKTYDERWLPEGFPLSDPRKSTITFEQILNHTSGLCPESQEGGRHERGKNYTQWVLGLDSKYTETAKLFYDPGSPEDYSGGTYSSIGFAHLGLAMPRLAGMAAHEFLWHRLLEPIGFSAVDYVEPPCEWSLGEENADVKWQTHSGLRMTTRDLARFSYFLLRDGRWGDEQVVSASWIRRFRASGDYPNLRGNASGYFGEQHPKHMFWTCGAGMNWALVIPSLDMVVVRTSRNDLPWNDIRPVWLRKLFDCAL